METVNTAMDKLNALLASGVITHQEYEVKRQDVVNKFLGLGGVGATARPAFRRPLVSPLATRRPAYGAPVAMRSVPLSRPGPMRGAFSSFRGQMGGAFSPYARPIPRNTAPRQLLGQPGTAIKVQPVPEGVDDQQLAEAFASYGEIVSAVVHRGTPAYGHVNFKTRESAAAAAATDRFDWGGQTCFISLSRKRWESTVEGAPSNGIGIFNLPLTITQDELQSFLSIFDGLTAVKMVYNRPAPNGRGGDFKGYAFAYFDTVDNATIAKQALLGQSYGESVLDVKFSNRPADQVVTGF